MNKRIIKESCLQAYEQARRAGWPEDFISRATIFLMDELPKEMQKMAADSIHALDEFPYPEEQFVAIRNVCDERPKWIAYDYRMPSTAVLLDPARSVWHTPPRGNMLVSREHFVPGFSCFEGVFSRNPLAATWEFIPAGGACDQMIQRKGPLRDTFSEHLKIHPLALFYALAVPTQYIVDARLPEFGPGPFRRRFRNKPICMHLKFERLYRLYEMAHSDEERPPVEPHGRHGHIRHYWRAAGVDKRVLPASPKERLRLVQTKRVRRQYIHPTWIGETKWTFDGVQLEVRVGESDLPLLGSPTTRQLRGRRCENCGAPIDAIRLGIRDTDGRTICCHHCILNPDGCRCRFGESGVPQDGPLSQAKFSGAPS